MRVFPRNFLWLITGVTIGAASALLATEAGVAESGAPVRAMPALITPAFIADPAIAADATLLSDDAVTFTGDQAAAPAPAQPVEAQQAQSVQSGLDPQLECMAKVVRHEAANQSRRGQLAVAQLIMNRARAGGRFPTTACDVANQPGQFFNTASYNPRRDTAEWQTAVDVSREAMAGTSDDVTKGAYFYHAASQAPNGFFRNRQRVQTLGDHIFYR